MSDTTLSGIDIGKVMASTGPIVKCVILRAQPLKSGFDSNRDVATMSIREMKSELESYGSDASSIVEKADLVKALEEARSRLSDTSTPSSSKPPQDCDNDDTKASPGEKSVPLSNLIDEIEVDTTPRKSMVSKILGGEFTFIGQYEEEGIMAMTRRPDWENEDSTMTEAEIPPINPHKLQPPLNDIEVRGDILLMRVAETDEALDSDGEVEEGVDTKENSTVEKESHTETNAGDGTQLPNEQSKTEVDGAEREISVPSNEEFFLDYTKEEYLRFAARTDIVALQRDEEDDEEDDNGVDDEEEEAEETENNDEEEESVAGSDEEVGNDQGELNENEINAELNPEHEVLLEASLEGHEEEGEEDDHDEEFEPEGDEEDFDSEEHQVGMMNLILGQILRKFHEEHGRGPDTLELLEMRKALADRLGVEVPPVDEDACDWDKKVATPKRHNKKVKVVEENNRSETIPGIDDDEEVVSLKRPAVAMKSDEEEEEERSNKRAKHDDGTAPDAKDS